MAEWVRVSLAFATIVVLFYLFLIRRQTVELNLEHSYTVRSPEFFSSARAVDACRQATTRRFVML